MGKLKKLKGRLLIIRNGNGNRPFLFFYQLLYFRFSWRIFFLLLCFWLQLLCHVESSLAAITHGEDNSSTTAHNVTAGIDGRL